MPHLFTRPSTIRQFPLIGSFLDNLIHPHHDPSDHDPGAPFAPPPSQPSPDEDEDGDDGPSLPMDPALA